MDKCDIMDRGVCERILRLLNTHEADVVMRWLSNCSIVDICI